MLKTFFFGVLLGIAVAVGALYAVPVIDQHREISLVSVAPNGGNRESFHINIPLDRVMVGAAGQSSVLPPGLKWPEDEILANVSSEFFKVRNDRNTVIGVAARTVAKEDSVDVIEWLVHLPARGSLFFRMEPEPRDGGQRIGALRAGSQEFDDLTGFIAEQWVSDTSEEVDAPMGRIELLTTYVGISDPAVVDEAELPE